MRYNETEKQGILAADTAFTNELHWIYRTQAEFDVGIDAFVEKAENGTPLGKFLAVQVKSGDSSFKVKEESLTLYVSNVHYHYWLNLNLPIVLIAYLPSTQTCYWQLVKKSTLKATKKKWKLNIPRANVLDKSSILHFEKAFVEFKSTDVFAEAYRYDDTDLSSEYQFLRESTESLSNLCVFIEDMGAFTRKISEKMKKLGEAGKTAQSSEYKSLVKQQNRHVVSQSTRLTTEIKLFSECFSEEFYIFEKFLFSHMHRGGIVPEAMMRQIEVMPERISNALEGTKQFKTTAEYGASKYQKLKASYGGLAKSLDLLCTEYQAAYNMSSRLRLGIVGKQT